jgi:hypothetical protein
MVDGEVEPGSHDEACDDDGCDLLLTTPHKTEQRKQAALQKPSQG